MEMSIKKEKTYPWPLEAAIVIVSAIVIIRGRTGGLLPATANKHLHLNSQIVPGIDLSKVMPQDITVGLDFTSLDFL